MLALHVGCRVQVGFVRLVPRESSARACRSRARALSASREIFGRAAFDRFLYEAVAPGAVVLTSTPSGTSSRAELEAWIEEGCQ